MLQSVTWMRKLGRVLDELDRLGMAERTVVLPWSDHGYQMGEHGIWGKHTNFEDAVLTPMILRVPEHKHAGTACEALVELVDIYPTLSEMCGFGSPDHLEGTSFLPLVERSDRPWKLAAFTQYRRGGTMGRSIRTRRYRYTHWRRNSDGKTVGRELYDHFNDPCENTNVAADPQNRALVRRLEAQLGAGWRADLPVRP